jgi:carbonic anhydrase
MRSFRWALGSLLLILVGVIQPAHADGPPAHHWGYSGEESPAHWGDIAAVCAKGQAQSPIGFNSRGAITKGPFPKMEIDWQPTVTGEAVDNGHTIQVNVPPGNFLVYGGTRYELKQFHFHSPSEHNVNGEHTAMEMHFVNQTPEGKTAVLGVLLTTGRANAGLEPIFSALPPPGGTPKTVQVDLGALLPKDRTHFAYAGSLTTPPCTEGVQWLVIVAQPEISKAQVDAFHARYPANARPTQAWHGRKISIAP